MKNPSSRILKVRVNIRNLSLNDDVIRVLVEINSAWKVKPAVDPTDLPEGKVQAKFNAVTLPENQSADFGDVEPSTDIPAKHTTMGFQQNRYFAMQLYTIDELTERCMESLREKEPSNHQHQADANNVTLDDNLESFQAGPACFNRYERFDIEGDEETQFYFPSQEHPQKPPASVHSPLPELQPQRDDGIRVLVEINSAWKVKPAVDPRVLPEGKVQAKFNAVILPENQSADFSDIEPSIDILAKHTTMGFQESGYFAMLLDTIDELTESHMESIKEKEPNNQHHQADAVNVYLNDNLESFQACPTSFNRYVRFNAVTLPDNQSADFGDVEPSIDVPAKHTTMGFQQNGYFAMCAGKDGEKWPPVELEDMGEANAENFKGITKLSEFIDETCHSMDYLGLYLETNSLYDPSWASEVKVAIIDSAQIAETNMTEAHFLQRDDISTTCVHDGYCRNNTRLSDHGIFCASILAGKAQEVNLLNVCVGKIRGVVPSCKLYTYAVGCPDCCMNGALLGEAIERAAKLDHVDIISSSCGRLRIPSPQDDDHLRGTLEAYSVGTLTCLSAGNAGPDMKTIKFGYPWCLNVGACTFGKILLTELTIATSRDYSQSLEVIKIGDREMNVLERMEGFSVNLIEDDDFYPFRIPEPMRGIEGIVFLDVTKGHMILDTYERNKIFHYCKEQLNIGQEEYPWTSVRKDQTNHLLDLWDEFGHTLNIRMCTSKFHDDNRKVFVPAFSGRGPAPTHPEIMMPDVVAPGVGVVASFPNTTSITSTSNPLKATQSIMSGTSMSVPHVAGAAAIVKHHHMDWGPSAIKSALMTTATRLSGSCLTGDEFSYGAGVINPLKAINPGLVYEEVYDNFARYIDGTLEPCNLNLPSFAACFSPSHEAITRTFKRVLKCVYKDGVTYKSKVEIYTKSLDPKVSIEVVPNVLEFLGEGHQLAFTLNASVVARADGHVSASLIWHAPDCVEVISPIIFYSDTTFRDPEVEANKMQGERNKRSKERCRLKRRYKRKHHNISN